MLFLRLFDEMHVLLLSNVRAVDYDDLSPLLELFAEVLEVLVLIRSEFVDHYRRADAFDFVYIDFGVA
jgi:hypothetical protein